MGCDRMGGCHQGQNHSINQYMQNDVRLHNLLSLDGKQADDN
jgi:hypothetical protein